MTQKIRVVTMVMDGGNITFYKEDGEPYVVTQGDPRGPSMVNFYTTQKALGDQIVEIPVSEAQAFTMKHLSESQRSPLLKFFRAPINAVKRLLGYEASGNFERDEQAHAEARARVAEVTKGLMSNVGSTELPVRIISDPSPLMQDETIIAVSEDGIMPGVEHLSDQLQAEAEGKAPAFGIDNLMLRMTKIAKTRGHTAQELVHFIKKIDLPAASSGAFFAYKRLIRLENEVFVDPHSRRVHQRVGDIVQMAESLVDPSRRQECSQGIHVGSRHYMGGFHAHGDSSATCLVLIEPEDVIAVPERESSKMRVCRYLLIGELSGTAHQSVNRNKPIDPNDPTLDLVARAVAGWRPALLGVVNIGGEGGTNLTYTVQGRSISTGTPASEALKLANSQPTEATAPVTQIRTIQDDKQNVSSLLPQKVRKEEAKMKVADVKKQVEDTSRTGIAKRLADLMRNADETDDVRGKAARDLLAFKKKAKVSWLALGLQGDIPKEIEEIIQITEPVVKLVPTSPPAVIKVVEPQAKPAAEVKAKPEPKAPVQVKVTTEVKTQPVSETRGDKARRLWKAAESCSGSDADRRKALAELYRFKKAAKVSWEKLTLDTPKVEALLKKFKL